MTDTENNIYKCASWYCKDSKNVYTENEIYAPFPKTNINVLMCGECAEAFTR